MSFSESPISLFILSSSVFDLSAISFTSLYLLFNT
jgi:hypothetical protein